MHPIYHFRVNLLGSLYSGNQPDKNIDNISNQLESATVYIEGVDHALKHNDVFTASGEKAVRIKNLADSGQLSFTLDTYEIPDIEDLQNEVNGSVMFVAWGNTSDEFYAYFEIRVNGGQWVFAQLAEIGDSQISLRFEEESEVEVRARFTDNAGGFSTNYATTSGDVAGLPEVTTDDLDFGFSANATVTGTLVSSGTGDVTSIGFVWAEHEDPTLDDNVEEVFEEDEDPEFVAHISSLPFPATVYFRAYATNSVGTAYGENLSGETEICLVQGTKITLPDGSKKNIEDVTYEDELLVWNFDEGRLDQAKPVWMVRPFRSGKCAVVKFSDGSELGTIVDGKGHRIFNREKGMFTHMMSDDTPIGTTTYNENGDVISVVSKEIVEKEVVFYNIITNLHFNVYANTILTSTGLNNLYPVENMRFVKNDRASREIGEFDWVPDNLRHGLRLTEQPASYYGLKAKMSRLKRRQW